MIALIENLEMVSAITCLPTDLLRTDTITQLNDMSTIWPFDASTSTGGSFDVDAQGRTVRTRGGHSEDQRDHACVRVRELPSKNHVYHPDIRAGGGQVMTGDTAFVTSSARTAMTPRSPVRWMV
jgi:hypothetical protein